MNRRRLVRTALYLLLGIVALALLGGGYLWYTVKHTMDAMYEPLPEKTWSQPVFEQEAADKEAAEPGESKIESSSIVYGSNALPVVSVLGRQPEGGDSVKTEPAINNRDSLKDVQLDDALVDRLRHPNLDRKDPFSMLLLGVDERQGDRGRSDTMILLAIQPANRSVLALSIPRDTRVLIPQKEYYDKINHAYAFGGTSLSVAAVERLFGIPIAYYMKTNMEGLIHIVDTVGGIEVDNAFAFTSDGTSFPKGTLSLDGEDALRYVRMRYEDPHGDFGRTQRQRQVLSALVDNIVSVRSIGKLPQLLSKLSKEVRTNLTSGDMLNLASAYRSSIDNVETLYLKGTGKMIDGIYYYTVQPEDRKAIQRKLLEQLQAAQ